MKSNWPGPAVGVGVGWRVRAAFERRGVEQGVMVVRWKDE